MVVLVPRGGALPSLDHRTVSDLEVVTLEVAPSGPLCCPERVAQFAKACPRLAGYSQLDESHFCPPHLLLPRAQRPAPPLFSSPTATFVQLEACALDDARLAAPPHLPLLDDVCLQGVRLGCWGLRPALRHLLGPCTLSLKVLDVSLEQATPSPDDLDLDIGRLLRALPRLETLRLEYAAQPPPSDAPSDPLVSLSLTELRLVRARIQPAPGTVVLPALRKLYLDECAVHWGALEDGTGALEVLELRDVGGPHCQFDFAHYMPRAAVLRVLTLTGVPVVNWEAMRMPRLREFMTDLWGCSAAGVFLEGWRLPELSRLVLVQSAAGLPATLGVSCPRLASIEMVPDDPDWAVEPHAPTATPRHVGLDCPALVFCDGRLLEWAEFVYLRSSVPALVDLSHCRRLCMLSLDLPPSSVVQPPPTIHNTDAKDHPQGCASPMQVE